MDPSKVEVIHAQEVRDMYALRACRGRQTTRIRRVHEIDHTRSERQITMPTQQSFVDTLGD